MKAFFKAGLEVLFALFILSLNWHWAFIVLLVLLIPTIVVGAIAGLGAGIIKETHRPK